MKTNIMDALIDFKSPGLTATFNVEQENDLTYNLRLTCFQGSPKPPLYLKIHKTSAGWQSAFENLVLVQKLGQAIDASCQ